MKKLALVCLIIGLCCFTSSMSFASSYITNTGITLSTVAIGKDPSHLHGVRASLWYQPPSLVWKQWSIYFTGSAGHWWVDGNQPNRSLNIYALAPVARLYLLQKGTFNPYLEASVGLSYLTRTRFDDRNLGMHFAFQDELGLGATFGKQQQFFATLSALHYSNGSLCGMNAGITVPLFFSMGYRFG